MRARIAGTEPFGLLSSPLMHGGGGKEWGIVKNKTDTYIYKQQLVSKWSRRTG